MNRWTPRVNVDGDVVNVKDFGAKGDGHSEDHAAIQAAVNSLGASGGIVLLPPGNYKITKTIHVSAGAAAKTSVWFRGSGSRNGTNLYWYGDADSAMIQVSGSGAYGSTFHRFSDFQLDAGTSTPPKYGIYLTGASNGGATGVTNTRFERIYIAHAQVGLQIGDATQPNVAENWFTEIQVDGCIGSGAVVTGSVTQNIHFINCGFAYNGIKSGAGYGVEVLNGASADFINIAWGGSNHSGQLHFDANNAAAVYILGGHAELNSPFLVTDTETVGGNINKSVITMVGLNIGAGSLWTPGSDIIRYRGSGALVFIGGRFVADGVIRVENPMSYPNPSVLNYGLMLDGKATFVLGSAVAYSSLVPVEGGGGAPVMTTNVAHQFNNGIAIASPAGATLNVPLNASTSVGASLSLQSAGATRWNLLRRDATDDFYLQRATGAAGSEAVENLVRILNRNGYIGIKTQSLEAPSSFLHVNASFATAITTRSSNYTLTDNDHTVLGNAKEGAFTLTLPPASVATGRIYIIKKIDSTSNSLNIRASGSDKMDGTLSPIVLTLPSQVAALQSDGVEWWRITN